MKEQLLRKIRSLIRRAVVSLSLPDDGDHPIMQISYLGKTANAEVIWPYGMGGQLPENAQVFCFNIEGMEENKAGIGTTPTLRLKVDAEGETCFGNPLTGSVTYFRANGDIETIGKNDESIIISGNSNKTIGGNMILAVTGNVNIDVDGDVNLNAAGTINLDGGDGNLGGVITEKSICPVTGNPHVDPSTDVKASHA